LLRIALYIALAAIGHFVWELCQLPLYTPWRTGTPSEIVSALFDAVVLLHLGSM